MWLSFGLIVASGIALAPAGRLVLENLLDWPHIPPDGRPKPKAHRQRNKSQT